MNNAMSYHMDGVVAQVKLAIIHLHDQKGSSFKSIKDCLACDASEDQFIRAALNKGTKENIFTRRGNRWLVATQSNSSGGNSSANSSNNIPAAVPLAVRHAHNVLRPLSVNVAKKVETITISIDLFDSLRINRSNVFSFKIKRTMRMRKIFQIYADSIKEKIHNCTFLIDGDRVDSSLMAGLLLEDGGKVDCFLAGHRGVSITFIVRQSHADSMTISILDVHENTRMYFCVSRGSTKMSEVLKAYAQEKKSLNESINRYLFHGQNFGKDDTPKILEMEDGDSISLFHSAVQPSRRHRNESAQKQ